MPVNAILLIGPTGAGKTPLGGHVEKHGAAGKRHVHFDFGHQLRTIAEYDTPPEGFDEAEHAFIREVLEKGLLLENEHFVIARKIIALFLRRCNFRDSDVLLLNGLPRHRDQAKDMEDVVKVKGIIALECAAGDVHARIRKNTGLDRTGRTDDSLEMVGRKLEIFRNRTEPLIDYYAAGGVPVFTIKVTSDSTTEQLYSSFCVPAFQ